VLACSVFLPYGILLKAAFARAWAQPLTRGNFTLENWSFTFLHGATQSAIANTLELGVLTACETHELLEHLVPLHIAEAGLATLLAYVTNRRLIVGHQVLGFLALAPVVIPGVVLAVALFVAYTRPPFLLYGTLWILFLAYLTKEMPVGYSQADATMRGIHPELEEAGRILGAGRLRVLREITAPLARSGIIATWCFVFIGVIRELSASIILFTPNTKVISVVIFDLKEEGQFGAIAVLGVFMLVMTFVIVAAMQALLGRDVWAAPRADPMPGVRSRPHQRYGDVAAVEGLELRVEPGELVALLGPSGCGKTTTLRLVAGFLKPEAGEIWVGERCLSSPAAVVPPERRRMAMIFQSYALWPHMTVDQNVAYGLRFTGQPERQRSAGARCSGRCSSRATARAIPASCRAASSSGWRWRAPWWWRPRSCCWTSRSRISTRASARRCASRSDGSTSASASPPSTSPTTRRRPW
jgi:ABC-type spermidine/putrescine transport system permease subunit II